MPSKLKAFEESIVQALKADARRPKHERRTARALFGEIKAQGYEGGYSRVTPSSTPPPRSRLAERPPASTRSSTCASHAGLMPISL
jgi:hypothetical protein